MGSTRHGLLSTTSAAAIDTLAAAPSAASIAASAPIASPTSGDRISQRITTTAHHALHAAVAVHHGPSTTIASSVLHSDAVRAPALAVWNSASATSASGTARGAFPLLRPHTGRHALDERRRRVTLRSPAHGPAIVRTVKNLRIVGSAVLLLNFREVRDFHFCSTSAAM